MKSLGYYNGSFAELDSLYLPICDRAVYFGDGVYDVAYCYNHRIFALEEHVERFLNGAKFFGLEYRRSKRDLMELIERMANKVSGDALSVYFQLSRGTGYRQHEYENGMDANLLLMIREAELRDMKKPIEIGMEEDRRHGYCCYKTLNLLPNVMAMQRAYKKGYQEVVFYRNGKITECAHSNISIIKNGRVVTPPPDGTILPGIQREHLLRQCEKEGIPWKYGYLNEEDLFQADEIVLTAAGSLCLDVNKIDGKNVGGKDPLSLRKIRRALIKEFHEGTGANIEVER